MKKVIKTGMALWVGAVLLCLGSGCAYMHTASINPETHLAETFTGVVWLNKTALKGLEAHSRKANGSTAAVSIREGSTETQPEAVKAAGETLGIALGTAMKYAK
jgi:hypothetical protein